MALGSRCQYRVIFRTSLPSLIWALTAVSASFVCWLCPAGVVAQQATPARHPPPAFHFVQPEPINFDDHDGWTQIFDGKTLKNWDGDTDVWHVEDDALVGESSPEHPSGTTNIIWRGGEPANFELKLEMKLEGTGANGGVQYRSFHVEPNLGPLPADLTPEQRQRRQQQQDLDRKHAKWNVSGYQADFDFNNQYTGQLYEQSSPRGIIAWRGQVVATEAGKKPTLLATLGSSDELKSVIKPGEWNQVEIIANGNTLVHIINGHIMSVLVDTDPKFSQAKGLIAVEIEGPGNVKISHRNIWLKTLP
jgi:3-keto-disaccharide hydrolase